MFEGFVPDYTNIVDAARNRAAKRLPLYEHQIDDAIMEKIVGREFSGLQDGSAAEAADALTSTEGNILLATGTKELADFAGLSPERLIPRVLPTAENLAACEALGIPRRNIVAMQGPFSTDLNAALLRQKDIRFFVTKDGGPTGGFPEKAEAAEQAGVPLLVITPPEEDGLSVEEFLEVL